jgi:WD40 repeat protein
VDFNPTSTLLATGSADKSVKLILVLNSEEVLLLPSLHEGFIFSVRFNSDGTLLATGSADMSVKLISVPDGEVMLHPPGLHKGRINSVRFNPTGTLLFTGSEDWGCAIVLCRSLIETTVWPTVLLEDHPARCPSLRQCESLLAMATAPAQENHMHTSQLQRNMRATEYFVHAIRNFPWLLLMSSSASSDSLYICFWGSSKTTILLMQC